MVDVKVFMYRFLPALLFLAAFTIHEGNASDSLMLSNFRLSPSGETVAFQFSEGSRIGLGLLDWKSRNLVRVPNPEGKQLSDPSFSDDGHRVVAAMGNFGSLVPSQIVIVELPSMNITKITDDIENGKLSPIFQPGSNNILYVQHRTFGYAHLKIFDDVTKNVTTLLPESDGFRSGIFYPKFVGSDDLIFEAILPNNPTLKKYVVGLVGADPIHVSYTLKLGKSPEVIISHIQGRKDKVGGITKPNIRFISATKYYKKIFFVDLNADFPYNDRI